MALFTDRHFQDSAVAKVYFDDVNHTGVEPCDGCTRYPGCELAVSPEFLTFVVIFRFTRADLFAIRLVCDGCRQISNGRFP